MAIKGNEICRIELEKRDLSSNALKKFYKNLDKHNVTVGIHKEEGAKQVGNNGFTLIQNACIQEFGNTQTVQKTRRFRSPMTGKWFTFKEGWKIETPARPFVRIFNDKKEKKGLTQTFKEEIELNKKTGDAKGVYNGVGIFARLKMKERIISHKVKAEWKKGKPEGISAFSNTKTTQRYKGSNTPLYLTGTLFDSIESKVH